MIIFSPHLKSVNNVCVIKRSSDLTAISQYKVFHMPDFLTFLTTFNLHDNI